MKTCLLLPFLTFSLGIAHAIDVPTAFVTYPSLAKTSYSAAGEVDLTFGSFGQTAISPAGEGFFESRLVGSGSTRGRNRSVFYFDSSGSTWLSAQSGTLAPAFAGIPLGAKITSVFGPINNRTARPAIFQATVSGKGINSSSNRLILKDELFSITAISRTGAPLAALGGATPSAYREVLQQDSSVDRIAVLYSLKRGVAGTTASSDSGLLLMNHTGVVTHAAAREGNASFPLSGGPTSFTFGQFNSAAVLNNTTVGFLVKLIPTTGRAVDGICQTGSSNVRFSPTQGQPADGTFSTELYGTFTGISRISTFPLLRANMTKCPAATNQGVWSGGGMILLRKGDDIGSGVTVRRIIRVWGTNTAQLLAHVQLSNRAQALLLRRSTDGTFQTLISTRAPAPSLSGIDVAVIQAIDVDPVNGHYAVVGSLKGSPSNANQALWTGQTTLGDDTTQQGLRLPFLALRKGEILRTTATPTDTLRSIALTPPSDRTGVGARGFAQQINSAGQTLVTVTGDRRTKEIIIIP